MKYYSVTMRWYNSEGVQVFGCDDCNRCSTSNKLNIMFNTIVTNYDVHSISGCFLVAVTEYGKVTDYGANLKPVLPFHQVAYAAVASRLHAQFPC